MPLPHDLKKYVEEAAALAGIPLEQAWTPPVAEHLGRLRDAWQVIEEAGLVEPESATRYEP